MASPIVTLTTDFGASDAYVAAIKGVVLAIAPDATIVDISHAIPPQDIAHGAFVIGSAYRYFRPDTIHVGVVDPGVGTSRRALLVVTPEGRFLAPDNGLLTYVFLDDDHWTSDEGHAVAQKEIMEPVATPVPDGFSAYALTRDEYWRRPVTDTFHGRDIFAPVAAHLARGVPPEQLGDIVDQVTCLNIYPPDRRGGAVEGRVIFVDHFGNLVSNIRSGHLPGDGVEVEVGGRTIRELVRSFAEGGHLLALVGSHGFLEVAARNGSAAARLGVGVGSSVRVLPAGSANPNQRR